jgi:hypothetical protein
VPPAPLVSIRRKRLALAIAALADAIQLGFFPFFAEGALSIPDDILDAVSAFALLLTLGPRWSLVAALGLELVPGVALFPTWTTFVLTVRSAPSPAPALPPAVE